MNDVVCVKVRLKPNSLPQVRAWAREMANRRTEAMETLAAEGVSLESVFLDSDIDGDFLVYYMRAQSIAQAQTIAANSTASIQQFHTAFKREAWSEVRKLELLLDLERTK